MIFPASLYYNSQFTNPALSMTNYSQTNRKKLPLRRWEPAVSFSLVSVSPLLIFFYSMTLVTLRIFLS